MPDDAVRVIRLRRPDVCRTCGADVPAGERAEWDPGARTVRCLGCASVTADEDAPGDGPASRPAPADGPDNTGGASAQREYERRRADRDAKVRARFPRIGGLLLALTDDPASTKAWARGAKGERVVARALQHAVEDGVVVFHDRRIPGRRSNIDHIAVAPTGVFVIDAKRYTGRVERRAQGSLLRPQPPKLYVSGRDKTALVDGMTKQVDAVRGVLTRVGLADGVAIRPILCFVEADWAWFAKPFDVDGVRVLWPKALLELVRSPGPLDPERIVAIASHLDTRLPPS